MFICTSNVATDICAKDFSMFDLEKNLISSSNLPCARVLRREKIKGELFLLETQVGRFNIKVFSEDVPNTLGLPGTALISFQDVTELKALENNLFIAETDLNEAVNVAKVGFWSLDISTQKATISPQLMRQFDITPDKFIGSLEQILIKIHEKDRPSLIEAIEKNIADGSPYFIECRVIVSDGSVRWIEACSRPAQNKNLNPAIFAGTTIDITEKVKARHLPQVNERNLRLLAESMSQIVWSALPSGELDYFNRVWLNYSGSSFEENLFGGWKKFAHPDDVPLATELWTKSLATLEPFATEIRILDKNGNYRWHEARAVPIFEEGENLINRKIKKWYGTDTDIHDRKLFVEKMKDAKHAADLANSAKSQFLANMSHEIRTPLGAIMGFSELVREKGLGQLKRDEYLSVIERHSSQLLKIIDDILDLSKVEAGMMSIENTEFSLQDFINDFSSLMRIKARAKGIHFKTEIVTSILKIIVSDPTRIRQILMNIIGNAIKFTDHGYVELRVKHIDEFLEFEVEDTGRGISAEQEKILFKPFTQADVSTTRKYGGTGLGLVLARSLAEALGGSFILQRSELGKGSLFLARVRIAENSNSKIYLEQGLKKPSDHTSNNVGQLEGMRVLIVDDCLDNQTLISIFLNQAGAYVEVASNGEQGYDMALSSKYNVILMDIQMPVMDGVTAVKKLREMGYSGSIVALTAHTMKDERERCLKVGFNYFLSKPMKREDLIKTVLSAQN